MSIDPSSKGRARWIACTGALAATALAMTAVHAQVTQPTDSGVMSFPNVRVVTMTPAANAAAPAAQPGVGMRAFVDLETGKLTENPTAAHLQELEAAEAGNRTNARKSAGALSTMRMGNAVRARLDASSMLYAVVRRADDGDLDMACVVGDTQVNDFLTGRGESVPHVHSKAVAERAVK